MTASAPPPTSATAPVTTAHVDVPHPRLTHGDRAAISGAVTRYTAATGVALAGIATGAALAAVFPAVGAAVLVLAFLTGVVVFARRLDLSHPRAGSRYDGKPLTLRVNRVAATAYTRWLDHDAEGGSAADDEIRALLVELADLTAANRGDTPAAHALTDRLVAVVGHETRGARGPVRVG